MPTTKKKTALKAWFKADKKRRRNEKRRKNYSMAPGRIHIDAYNRHLPKPRYSGSGYTHVPSFVGLPGYGFHYPVRPIPLM